MLKLTIGVLALVLASSASAAGWRSLRIDASSEASFNESVAALKDKLPRVRRAIFEQSLIDIFVQGTKAAEGDEGEYTSSDYLRQLDGLGYKEIVTFTDPTGDTADRYWDQAYTRLYGPAPGPLAGDRNPFRSGGGEVNGPSRILDAGQSFRAEGRLGGNRH